MLSCDVVALEVIELARSGESSLDLDLSMINNQLVDKVRGGIAKGNAVMRSQRACQRLKVLVACAHDAW